ncbi:MAG: recombinase family protein [Candidatus Andersenbacteria bacterium]|nr:recombinase family protein [Candidatus Andersenbacteria bacterium]
MPSSNANFTDAPIKLQSQIAALYARVSTARQEDEETIEVQIADIKARVTSDGNELAKENIFLDDGWTGTILKRPGLDDMRKAALDGKFQVLYTYDRGRIARKYSYQEIVIEELEDRSIRFLPLHDKEVVTDEDRLFQGMQGLFSEWERFKIADRFRIAKLRRAEGGRLVNGHALYGWKIVRTPGASGDKKDETREYVIDEEESHIIRLIFHWFVDERVSLRQIIERLYAMTIMPRKQKSDSWTTGPLERILTCKSYVEGKVYFNKHEAIVPKNPIKNNEYRRVKKSSRRLRDEKDWIAYSVPPILEDDGTFEKAQLILDENKRRKAKNRKRSYLLSGKVFCECGHRRVGDPGGYNNRYYRCAQRIYNHPKPTECMLSGINAEALDAAVWATLEKIMTDPTILQSQAEVDIKTQAKGTAATREVRELQHLTKKVTAEHDRYTKAYGAGDMPFEQFRKFSRDAKRRLKLYDKQMAALQTEATKPAESVDELCQVAANVLRRMAEKDKMLLISNIVKKVVVEREEVELQVQIPLQSRSLPVKFQYRAKSRNRWIAKCRKIDAF